MLLQRAAALRHAAAISLLGIMAGGYIGFYEDFVQNIIMIHSITLIMKKVTALLLLKGQ